MQRTPEVVEKIKKNILVHQYSYRDSHLEIDREIDELNEKILELQRKKGTRINIYLPAEFADKLFTYGVRKNNLRIPNFVEWTTNFNEAGQDRQRRELVYVEKITDNADFTAVFDKEGDYITDFSSQHYKMLDGYSYGNKSIIRLSGIEGKI